MRVSIGKLASWHSKEAQTGKDSNSSKDVSSAVVLRTTPGKKGIVGKVR